MSQIKRVSNFIRGHIIILMCVYARLMSRHGEYIDSRSATKYCKSEDIATVFRVTILIGITELFVGL